MKRQKLVKLVGPLLLLSSMITFQQCDKKEDPLPPEPPNHLFALNFNASTISHENVDSVVIILQKQGSPTTFRKKLTKQVTDYSLSLEDIEAGNYQSDIEVYTNREAGSYLYVQSTSLQLPLTAAQTIVAPTGKLTDQWKAWLYIQDLNVEAKVPLDPTNPHFEIRTTDQRWSYFYVERRILQGTQSVEAASWECQQDCYTQENQISNNTAFATFAERANNKTWNKEEILIMLLNDVTGDDWTLYRLYEK